MSGLRAKLVAMKSIALSAIRFYQRSLSAYKGFCCAYASYSGRASCSELGFRAIRRHGVWEGLSVLNQRLEKCGVAHRRRTARVLGRQNGFLDCGGCDVGGCDSGPAGTCGDMLSCGGADCNWNKKRGSDDEQYVVIPARGNVRN